MPETKESPPIPVSSKKRLNDLLYSLKLADEDITSAKKGVIRSYEHLIKKMETKNDISQKIIAITEELLEVKA